MRRLLAARAWMVVTIATLALAAALPAAVTAASPPIKFTVRYGDGCISGTAAPGSLLSVKWSDAEGRIKAQQQFDSGSGIWMLCAHGNDAIVTGDRITASDGQYTRKYTVPHISVVANRVTDTFSGVGPAGRNIRIAYLLSPTADHLTKHLIRVGLDGTWSFTPHDLGDITGGLAVSVIWTSPNQDTLRFDSAAPGITLTLGSSRFSGVTTPFTNVSVTLSNGLSTRALASATAYAGSLRGKFHGNFRDDTGNALAVMPGYFFSSPSLAQDAQWIVPSITGSADKTRDLILGRCENTGTSSGNYVVEIERSGHIRGILHGTVDDQQGNFEADFSRHNPDPGLNRANVRSGDLYSIACQQTSGDWAQKFFRVP